MDEYFYWLGERYGSFSFGVIVHEFPCLSRPPCHHFDILMLPSNSAVQRCGGLAFLRRNQPVPTGRFGGHSPGAKGDARSAKCLGRVQSQTMHSYTEKNYFNKHSQYMDHDCFFTRCELPATRRVRRCHGLNSPPLPPYLPWVLPPQGFPKYYVTFSMAKEPSLPEVRASRNIRNTRRSLK